jgi:hypothetical protein
VNPEEDRPDEQGLTPVEPGTPTDESPESEGPPDHTETPEPEEPDSLARWLMVHLFGLVSFLVILTVAVGAAGASILHALVTEEEAAMEAWARVVTAHELQRDLLTETTAALDWDGSVPESLARYRRALGEADAADSFEEEVRRTVLMDAALAELVPEIYRAVGTDTVATGEGAGARRTLMRLDAAERLIAIERNRYNDVVEIHEQRLHGIPSRWIAIVFGFRELPRYGAPDEGS